MSDELEEARDELFTCELKLWQNGAEVTVPSSWGTPVDIAAMILHLFDGDDQPDALVMKITRGVSEEDQLEPRKGDPRHDA